MLPSRGYMEGINRMYMDLYGVPFIEPSRLDKIYKKSRSVPSAGTSTVTLIPEELPDECLGDVSEGNFAGDPMGLEILKDAEPIFEMLKKFRKNKYK